ncbi:hypothetical protein AOLE_13170 [Acinetobacter oleivorans DR1]|uniref:Uncharacterized protein n=1 Tax=Acinetobacter oleivorans (strain JCM 16667 / KCTC 23045 / DR1) TaxID=436717 RepID=A0AAN0P9V5_ACISD|nr:hypothetical protein AOLE_13170 [Acinetobacter oleivorans DR1]
MSELLVCKEVLPDHCQMIMVVEREKVDRLTHKNQHAQGVPLPFRRRGGTQGCPQKRKTFSCALGIRPVKADWRCRPAGKA